jgi:hypothetical protein
VHPELLKDQALEEFRKKLNEVRYHYLRPKTKVTRELREEDIRNALKRQEVLELDEEKWRKSTDQEKIQKVREIEKLWRDYSISLEDYDFLTLKSKTGEWATPEKLVLPAEYKPEHNIEILVGKGLFDLPLRFLDPEFIKSENDDEIRKSREFFKKLGVDKIVESGRKEGSRKGGIVNRIGILTAFQYERKNEREPRELGESEKRGYDIESKSKDEERYIEVKGSSEPSCDIFLTVNEFRALRNKRDKYFIYVVMDALRNPYLCVTRGDKLLDITDTKIIIPYKKWAHAKDDEFQP